MSELMNVLVSCVENASDEEIRDLIDDLQFYEGDNPFLVRIANMGKDIVRYERMEELYEQARKAMLVGNTPSGGNNRL